MNILNRLFPKHAELNAVKRELDNLSRQQKLLYDQNASLRTALTKAEIEHSRRETKLQDDLRKTKAILREQTDADLLLVSQKIIDNIIKGDKPEQSELEEQQSLMARRQSLSSQLNVANQMNRPLGGLNSLGSSLGGIFGFR